MTRYATIHILNHWLTFALVVVLVGSGLAYSYELGGSGAIWAHQIAGQVLIVVLALRIAARLAKRPKATGTRHPAWERALAGTVQIALYLCLIAFVVTGYVAASGLTDPALLWPIGKGFAWSDTGERLLELHFTLKWVLLGLLCLHFGGAAKHAIFDRDGTLASMWFTSRKDTSP